MLSDLCDFLPQVRFYDPTCAHQVHRYLVWSAYPRCGQEASPRLFVPDPSERSPDRDQVKQRWGEKGKSGSGEERGQQHSGNNNSVRGRREGKEGGGERR